MKRNMATALALALMAGISPTGETFEQTNQRPFKGQIKPKRPVLSGLKHIGAIPKGCSVVKATIQTRIADYHLEVEVEILAGTNKAFNQKLTKKEREVLGYIARTPVSELLKDERFKLTEVEKEKQQV